MIIYNVYSRWTNEESDLAARLRGDGLTDGQIGKRLDRTAKSVRQHLYARENPQKAAAYAAERNKNRQVIKTGRILDMENAVIHRPTPEMLEDRFQREKLPRRDLTAVLMGDPPVGLSALERRA